jgi:hypothetical protein
MGNTWPYNSLGSPTTTHPGAESRFPEDLAECPPPGTWGQRPTPTLNLVRGVLAAALDLASEGA